MNPREWFFLLVGAILGIAVACILWAVLAGPSAAIGFQQQLDRIEAKLDGGGAVGGSVGNITIGTIPNDSEQIRTAAVARGYLTTEEAATILGCTSRHVIDLINKGEIPAIKPGKSYEIDLAWLD